MLDIKFLVSRPGDADLSTSETDAFVGGAPLYFNTTDNGLALCKSWNAWKVVGLAVQARAVAASGNSSTSGGSANGRVSWVYGSGTRVNVFQGTEPDGTADAAAPYNSALTYVAGDSIYIDDNGLLTNDTSYARVANATTGVLTGQEPIAIVLPSVPSAATDPLILQLRRI